VVHFSRQADPAAPGAWIVFFAIPLFGMLAAGMRNADHGLARWTEWRRASATKRGAYR